MPEESWKENFRDVNVCTVDKNFIAVMAVSLPNRTENTKYRSMEFDVFLSPMVEKMAADLNCKKPEILMLY